MIIYGGDGGEGEEEPTQEVPPQEPGGEEDGEKENHGKKLQNSCMI